MPVLKTIDVKHNRESLADVISNVTPEDTPVLSAIGKTKATATYHENLVSELRQANKNNAQAEGAEAGDSSLKGPKRVGNFTQIYSETVAVSNTQRSVNSAGTNDELSRQLIDAGKVLKMDQEATIVSSNASQAGNIRKTGGMEAWISTNALHGTNGASTGFVNGLVNAPTAGTARALTMPLIQNLFDAIWQKSGSRKLTLIGSSSMVAKIRAIRNSGGQQITMPANEKTISDAVDYFDSQYGIVKVMPVREISSTTVIAFDPSLWAYATLRKFTKEELGRTGDSTKYLLTTEGTLESKNESGNGKIADLIP